jgi:hypothetical protein
MNVEWLVTGIFLFGGMIAAAVSLYIKRRKESQETSSSFSEIQLDDTNLKEEK